MALTPSTQQAAIIDWVISGSGNLLIQAYAGTGKTSSLLMLLPYMSGEVFIGAFNAAIKTELEGKVAKLSLPTCNVDVKTIHGAGLGAFKYGGGSRNARVEKDKVHFILDEMAEHDDAYATYRLFIAKLVGFAKRAGIGPIIPNDTSAWHELIDYYGVDDEIPTNTGYGCGEDDKDQELIENLIAYSRNVYQSSLDKCRERTAPEIDFDDMLLAPVHFNCRFKKYDWVLVDECQDSSPIRQEITVRMLKPGGRMVCVGDFYQMIYGFTGVAHTSMSEIKERMKMDELPLSVTYRCPKAVVAVANTWVPGLEAHPTAPNGIVRTVWLEPSQCVPCWGTGKTPIDAELQRTDEMETCKACNGSGKVGPGFWQEAYMLGNKAPFDETGGMGPDSAILCRNNRPIIELAYQLLRQGIPCQIEGRDFAGSLIKLCQRWKVRDLNTLETRLSTFKDKEAAKWRLKHNEERAVGVEDKVDTLITLLCLVRESGKSKVSDLVDKIGVMFGDTEPGTKPKVLTLSSVHKAKGKEWKRVYILGRNRYMPSPWAMKSGREWEIQSENNLLYVATTRAMSELVDIIVPETTTRKRNGGY